MKKMSLALALVLIALLGIVALRAEDPAGKDAPGAPPGEVPPPDPKGAECASGCAAPPPVTKLVPAQIEAGIEALAKTPVGTESLQLCTLLFHGADVRAFIVKNGFGPLSAEWSAFLRRELARTHVGVSLRVVDEEGRERVRVDDLRLPLDKKEHLHATYLDDFQTCEFNGTPKRVGLERLWTRY